MDDPAYKTAMAECLNGFSIESKAWARRPGTKHAVSTHRNHAARLIPFSFEDNLPYQAEVSDGFLRFLEGPRLIFDPSGLTTSTISSISTANPAVVTTTSAISLTAGATAIISLDDIVSQAAMPSLANRQLLLTQLTSTTFSLQDAVTGDTINGATLGWSAGLNATLNGVLAVASPYVNGDWAGVNYIQNETNMLLLEKRYAPQLLQATPPSADQDATFAISPASFVDGPYLDPIPDINVTPDVTSGLVTLTLGAQTYSATIAYSLNDYVLSSGVTYISLQNANEGNTPASSPAFWAATSPGNAIGSGGFQATDIGRHIRLYSEPPDWNTATTYAVGNVVKFNNVYWTALTAQTGTTPSAGSINPNQPGNLTTTWSLNPSAARWTWGRIVSLPASGAINPATGTPFGNLTLNGGLAAAFDGVTGQTEAQSAVSNTGSPVDSQVGLHFASAVAVSSVRLYPSSDGGFGHISTIGSHAKDLTLTFKLRGKTTAPANPSDGTLLGSAVTTTPYTNPTPFTIVSSDGVTTWNYIWVEVTGSSGSAQNFVVVSELQMFGSGSVAPGSIIKIQLVGDPLLYLTPIRVWRAGLFTATPDQNSGLPTWPTCGCYTEGRLWLGGAVRNRFDASVSNEFLTFSPTGEDGTVADNNAIDYTVNSSDLNAILWMEPDLQGIVLGTIGGEWLVDGPTTGGFSPTNIRARRMTQFGCANVQPRRTGLSNVFVQRQSQKIIEFLADVYSGRFVGKNLSEFGRDLCAPGIAEIAYTQQLDPVVWSRNTNGDLNGVTYHRSSLFSTTPPDIVAWHKHELGSGRQVESLIATSLDGIADTLSMVTFDPDTSRYEVELASPVFEENASILDAWFLDDAVVPVAGATTVVNGVTGITFGGLAHLEKKQVTAFIAGLDCGDYQVLSNAIFVPYGAANGLFTQRFVQQVASLQPAGYTNGVLVDQLLNIPAVIGFTYTSRGQILRPVGQAETGSATGPAFGKKRRAAKFGALLVNTQGINFGTDFDHLQPAKFETPSHKAISISQLYSGLYWGTVDDTYSFDGQLCWEISRPYPATVAAVGPFYETEN